MKQHEDNCPDAEFPSLDSFFEMRKNKDVALGSFFNVLLPAVFGVPRWNSLVKKFLVQDFVPANTKAYAYLLLECNYGVVVNNDRHKKWTGGNQRKGNNGCWESHAVDRYMEIREMVLEDRKLNRAFDKEYLKYKMRLPNSLESVVQSPSRAQVGLVTTPKRKPQWDFPAIDVGHKSSTNRAQM